MCRSTFFFLSGANHLYFASYYDGLNLTLTFLRDFHCHFTVISSLFYGFFFNVHNWNPITYLLKLKVMQTKGNIVSEENKVPWKVSWMRGKKSSLGLSSSVDCIGSFEQATISLCTCFLFHSEGKLKHGCGFFHFLCSAKCQGTQILFLVL